MTWNQNFNGNPWNQNRSRWMSQIDDSVLLQDLSP
jgi:hypothetical protein